MTNSLFHRVEQHRRGEVEFTSRYRIHRLVYCEIFKYVNNCINREGEIKKWSRAKKVELIEGMNPTWEDFAADWGKPIKLLTPDDPGDAGSRTADSSLRLNDKSFLLLQILSSLRSFVLSRCYGLDPEFGEMK